MGLLKTEALRLPALCLLFIIVLISSCSDAFRADGGADTITISGQVINQSDSQPIPNAVVEISSPAEYQQTTTSDAEGFYGFSLQAESSVNLTIQASKTDFETTSRNVTVSPGSDVTEINLEMTATSQNDNGEDNVGGEPAGAAAIVLTSSPLQAINIAETGDVVSSPFTFQVQDSAGRPLDAERAVEVQFRLINSPGGGEEIVPATATTNSDGKATTTLFSGNRAGPVKVQAIVERTDIGLTIRSSPVLIAIHGGFPDDEHFSLAPAKYNFEGYTLNNRRNTISVIVGDKFSNPVKPGTVVYFETSGGIIQGSGQTDADGIVEVDLISGEPRPDDAIDGSGGRDGYATVTARTVNENDASLSKEVHIVFSTSTASIAASPTTFDLSPNGGATFSYTVTDQNGNPMAAGTEISVEAGGGIEVTGDSQFTLGDYLYPGPGRTEFSFSIRDTDDENNDPADLTIQITVTSPSGRVTTYSGISGTRR